MDRRHVEIDLPARVAAHFEQAIDTWLSGGATAGSRLTLPASVNPALNHPAVTTAMSEIELRLVDLQGTQRPYYLIEAADRASARLIDRLEDKLTPKPEFKAEPVAAFYPRAFTYGYGF